MKYNFRLLAMSMTITLGALIILNSCGSDDDPITFESNPEQFCIDNPADSRCFDVNPDTFCANNPLDGQCCIPSQDLDCYCSDGDNGTTDEVNCCLFEYNPTCFCTANPGDAQCAQDFGVGNGLGLLIDFESGLQSFAEDFFNPSDKIEFNGDASISAVEGDSYLSLVLEVDDANKDWHDFKFDPNEGTPEATIDLSTMSDPTLNFWVNSGPNEADSLGFTVSFWGKDDGAGGNDATDYADHPLFKTGNTNGEWVLVSIPISEMGVQNGWDGANDPVDKSVKYKLIKFAFMPASWHVPGRFVAHVDAISLTDGPLEQLPWTK